jgi:hypothetical protein
MINLPLTAATQASVFNRCIECIQDALRLILQSKHLYQSVTIDIEKETQNLVKLAQGSDSEQKIRSLTRQLLSSHWRVNEGPASFQLIVLFPDVKLYCSRCSRVEAFNRISAMEIPSHKDQPSVPIQVFVVSYLCQSCKVFPEMFLFRREREKITLCGRAPIEHVEVPKNIPKPVAQFWRRAVVAYQSGEVLAANFLLRTLIEQWCKRDVGESNPKEKADVIIEKYVANLPEDFKNRFPSLRPQYTILSDDIHSATGSADVFERARDEILRHFDARSLFELSSGSSQEGKSSSSHS